MDSDEEFFGAGSIKVTRSKLDRGLSKRNSRERFNDSLNHSSGTTPQTKESDSEGSETADDEDDNSETRIDDVSRSLGNRSGTESEENEEEEEEEEEEKRTEDDPLSDVWDSADNDEVSADGSLSDDTDSNSDAQPFPEHEFVHVKTPSGHTQKVDLTPPETQLFESEKLRGRFYREKKGDECLREAVRCMTYTKILYGFEAPWKMGSQVELEEAAEQCLQAYSIAKAHNDDASESMAEVAKVLANAYAQLNTEEGDIYAESYFNEAIGCFQLVHGNLHGKTLKTQELLAKHLAAKKRPQEAISVFSPTLPCYLETFGEYNSKTAGAYKTLATFCLQAGNTVEGAKCLKKAVEIESEIFGSSHSKTQATKKALNVLLKNPSAKHLDASAKRKNIPRFQTIVKVPGLVGGFKRAMPDY